MNVNDMIEVYQSISKVLNLDQVTVSLRVFFSPDGAFLHLDCHTFDFFFEYHQLHGSGTPCIVFDVCSLHLRFGKWLGSYFHTWMVGFVIQSDPVDPKELEVTLHHSFF